MIKDFCFFIAMAVFMIFAILGIVEYIDGSIHKAIYNMVVAVSVQIWAVHFYSKEK
jgi:hypothetical protein